MWVDTTASVAGGNRRPSAVQPARQVQRPAPVPPPDLREERRPHVEARPGRGEQERELARAEVGMVEGGREAVEALPVLLVHGRAELLPQGRARVDGEQ